MAKRTPGKTARNERRKAFATMLNAVSVALLVTALLQPVIAGRFGIAQTAFALLGFVALQLAVYYVLGRLED